MTTNRMTRPNGQTRSTSSARDRVEHGPDSGIARVDFDPAALEPARDELAEEGAMAHQLPFLVRGPDAPVDERLAQEALRSLQSVEIRPELDAVTFAQLAGQVARQVGAHETRGRRVTRGLVRRGWLALHARWETQVLDALGLARPVRRGQ
jgi:hypothetical protein